MAKVRVHNFTVTLDGFGAPAPRSSSRAGRRRRPRNLVVAPLLAGAGERLFDNVGAALQNYQVTEMVSSPAVTHVTLRRQ